MEAITIRISFSDSNEGYLYDIWTGDQIGDDAPGDSDEGGICTTTMQNALGMAVHEARWLIEAELGHECPGCWTDLTDVPSGLSRFDYGSMCSDCCTREAIEGDFIAAR